MATHRLLPLLLLVLSSTAHAQGVRPDATECTRAQLDAFDSARFSLVPPKCNLQLRFDSCDDDCRAAHAAVLKLAPNCTDLTNWTMRERSENTLSTCDKGRADGRYLPRPPSTPRALPKCSFEQKRAWDKVNGHADSTCDGESCSDACRSTLEEGVRRAPLCVDVSGYWVGEVQKRWLIACLDARGDDYRQNAVVMMTATEAASAETVSFSVSNSTTQTRELNATAAAVTTSATVDTLLCELVAVAVTILMA